MFVGHYAVSLALKRVEKKASLGLLFLGVQFVDVVFFPLVLLGIERLNVVENFTQSTHFELEYLPYTHSLAASFIWAGFVYGIFRLFAPRNTSVALVMGIAVLSHWFLDLLVHTPDLPLWSDTSPKLGLGLWNSAIATYTLETAFLAVGLWMYLRSTRASGATGRYGMGVFVVFLLSVNAANVFGPLVDDSQVTLAISAISMYFLFAGAAHWLDGKRT